uniref:Uncharacterized protein n=1 Tax=Meloidogyne hapla TaxID=6305 RepID=A0A1I8BEA9_MELHA
MSDQSLKKPSQCVKLSCERIKNKFSLLEKYQPVHHRSQKIKKIFISGQGPSFFLKREEISSVMRMVKQANKLND